MNCGEDPLRRRPWGIDGKVKKTGELRPDDENMGKWPCGHRKAEKSGHRMAAEQKRFRRRCNLGAIAMKWMLIWKKSDKSKDRWTE